LHVQTRHPTPKIGRQSERLRGEWSKQASKKGSKHEGQQASQQASEASKQERTDARQGQQAVQHASGAKSNRAGEQARSKQASKKGRNTRETSRPARQQASKQASKHERRKASQNPQLVAGAELGHDCLGYECFVFVFHLSYNCREYPNENLTTWKKSPCMSPPNVLG
jgi:hypothetical protein